MTVLEASSPQLREAVDRAVDRQGVMHVALMADVSRQTLRKYSAGGRVTRNTHAKLVRWASRHADVETVRSAAQAWIAEEERHADH